jgi:Ni,Fe-hydrogenase III large subunit
VTLPVRLSPARWQEEAAGLLAGGQRFRTLYAAGEGVVRALFSSPSGARVVISTTAAAVPSLVELVPAAGWAEREAHDTHGIAFPGHEPLRPLLDHVADGDQWQVPVTGRGVHEVAVGPIHAGIIESGHFRFHVVGERILLLDLRLFYKHRGLERAAEGVELREGIAYAQRACAACSVANSVAYAMGAEELMGLVPGPELRRARTLLLELERLYNHLHDLSAICAGIGFSPGAMAFAALKERAQRLNMRLVGHRFLFGTVAVGRSGLVIDAVAAREAVAEIGEIASGTARTWREVLFNGSVQDRLKGVGVLRHREAVRLGAVGPAARASGLAEDLRARADGLAYEGFAAAVPAAVHGDVAARAEIRTVEVATTGRLLAELLDDRLESSQAAPGKPAGGVGIGRVEGPRGETVCCLEAKGGRITRLHLRTASFANWPALSEAVAGSILPEFPLINKSFELCYACVDR